MQILSTIDVAEKRLTNNHGVYVRRLAGSGVLAGSFFSSQLYSNALWLMLALCPTLFAIARGPRQTRQVA
jgi:hypothetical protein